MANKKAEEKTGAKVTASAVSICLALGLGIGCLAFGGHYLYEREQGFKQEAVAFVDQTLRQDNTLYLDDANNDYELPEYKKETMISRGKYIYEEITSRDILYCELLDEFYTKEGKPIAFIDTMDEEGNVIGTRMLILDKLSDPITIKSNEYIRLVNTKSFRDIIDMNLVVKMDSEKLNANNKYQGDVELKRR